MITHSCFMFQIRMLVTLFVSLVWLNSFTDGRSYVVNKRQCKRPNKRHLHKTLYNFTKRLPYLLQYVIPEVRTRSKWYKQKDRFPETIPFKYALTEDIGKDTEPCNRSILLEVNHLRYPSKQTFIQCRKRTKELMGSCKPVKIPVPVLRIMNPWDVGRKCFYVPYIEMRTVGCSWQPPDAVPVNNYTYTAIRWRHHLRHAIWGFHSVILPDFIFKALPWDLLLYTFVSLGHAARTKTITSKRTIGTRAT